MSKVTSRPKRLYKYEAFSERSLQNLKAQVIFFGSPKNFNDPYDCALTPVITPPSDTEIELVRASLLNNLNYLEKIAVLRSAHPEDLRKMLMHTSENALTLARENFVHRGISCFSEVSDELLMWSHYGGQYKGFCLEFDTSHLLFEKMRKVNYSKKMPRIDVATLLVKGDFEAVMELFSTKSTSWAYEREWRVLHAKAGTPFHYPSECLTGIYFGPEISSEALEIICLVLQGQNPHVKFWKGCRSPTEFKVEFEEFAYTPFLKANSGMVNSKASPTSAASMISPNH